LSVEASISQCWNVEDLSWDPVVGNNTINHEPPSKKLRTDFARKLSGDAPKTSSEGVENEVPNDGEETCRDDSQCAQEASKASPQPSKNLHSRRAHNPNRKVMRGFFVDSNGSTPEFFGSNCGGGAEIESDIQSTRVIFKRKKYRLPNKEPQKTWEKIKRKNQPTTYPGEVSLRTDVTSPDAAGGCAVAYFTFAESKIVKAKFTKPECLFIMEMVRKMGGDSQKAINWYDLAKKHYAKFRKKTPWLCFCHFRSTLQNPLTRLQPWSPDEDELLLKYLALQGPQYLLQGDSLMQTTRHLFPLRNTKQIASRARSTLVYPNYAHDAWDPDEQRKLALLMRAYSNELNPINCVSRMVHFPHRAPKSVAEKWNKSLDPALTYHPSTDEASI